MLRPAKWSPGRYLRITAWLRARYEHDGMIETHINGIPTAYTLIEQSAARKYIGLTRF